MPTVTLGDHRELRLPQNVTKQLRLRKGAKIDLLFLGDGLFLAPAGLVSKDQLYFYTPEWQAKEKEADQAIASGEVIGPFDNPDAAIKALRTTKL